MLPQLVDVLFIVFRFLSDYYVTRPGQACTKPLYKVLVTCFAAGDAGNGIRDYIVVFNEFVAASLHQQFDQIECRSLVTVRKPMVANNTVNQGRRFLMDQSVVAMIWAE